MSMHEISDVWQIIKFEFLKINKCWTSTLISSTWKTPECCVIARAVCNKVCLKNLVKCIKDSGNRNGRMLQLQKAGMCRVIYWGEYKTARAQPKQKAFNLTYSLSLKKGRKKRKKYFPIMFPSRHHMNLWILVQLIFIVCTYNIDFFWVQGSSVATAWLMPLISYWKLSTVCRLCTGISVNHISSSALGIVWSSWKNKMVQFISTVTAFCLVSY